MQINEKSNKEFSLSKLFSILKQGYLKIILSVIVGIILSLVLSFFIFTPKYSSTLDILVSQKKENSGEQFTNQQADLQVINTYKDVLKKPVILNDVLKKIQKKDNYKGNISDLEKTINIENQTESQVISITAKDQNPFVAADIANVIGDTFTKKIIKIMKVDNVAVVSKAKANKNPVFPNIKLNLVIGITLGFLIGSAYVLIKNASDTTVKDENFITENLSLILLGQVNHIDNKKKSDVSVKKKNYVVSHRRV